MITDYDLYCSYRKAQSIVKDRPYRLPKDWEKYKLTMNINNLEWLQQATVAFNTKWSNINVDEYMLCGFDLLKTFTYKNMIDHRIIELYIIKDKAKKRRISDAIVEINRSFAIIKAYMSNKPERVGYTKLESYCKFRDGEKRVIIDHYIKNGISPSILVYCIAKKYIILDDDERTVLPYITKNFREFMKMMNEYIDYIEEQEKKL